MIRIWRGPQQPLINPFLSQTHIHLPLKPSYRHRHLTCRSLVNGLGGADSVQIVASAWNQSYVFQKACVPPFLPHDSKNQKEC